MNIQARNVKLQHQSSEKSLRIPLKPQSHPLKPQRAQQNTLQSQTLNPKPETRTPGPSLEHTVQALHIHLEPLLDPSKLLE